MVFNSLKRLFGFGDDDHDHNANVKSHSNGLPVDPPERQNHRTKRARVHFNQDSSSVIFDRDISSTTAVSTPISSSRNSTLPTTSTTSSSFTSFRSSVPTPYRIYGNGDYRSTPHPYKNSPSSSSAAPSTATATVRFDATNTPLASTFSSGSVEVSATTTASGGGSPAYAPFPTPIIRRGASLTPSEFISTRPFSANMETPIGAPRATPISRRGAPLPSSSVSRPPSSSSLFFLPGGTPGPTRRRYRQTPYLSRSSGRSFLTERVEKQLASATPAVSLQTRRSKISSITPARTTGRERGKKEDGEEDAGVRGAERIEVEAKRAKLEVTRVKKAKEAEQGDEDKKSREEKVAFSMQVLTRHTIVEKSRTIQCASTNLTLSEVQLEIMGDAYEIQQDDIVTVVNEIDVGGALFVGNDLSPPEVNGSAKAEEKWLRNKVKKARSDKKPLISSSLLPFQPLPISSKPITPIPLSTLTKPTTPGKGWGAHMFARSNTWKCNVCMVRNSNSESKCASCEAPRETTSTTATKEIKIPKETVLSNNSHISSSSAFTFGSLGKTEHDTTSVIPRFHLEASLPISKGVEGSSKSKFSFGGPPKVKEALSSSSPPFRGFLATGPTTTPAKGFLSASGFIFGPSSQEDNGASIFSQESSTSVLTTKQISSENGLIPSKKNLSSINSSGEDDTCPPKNVNLLFGNSNAISSSQTKSSHSFALGSSAPPSSNIKLDTSEVVSMVSEPEVASVDVMTKPAFTFGAAPSGQKKETISSSRTIKFPLSSSSTVAPTTKNTKISCSGMKHTTFGIGLSDKAGDKTTSGFTFGAGKKCIESGESSTSADDSAPPLPSGPAFAFGTSSSANENKNGDASTSEPFTFGSTPAAQTTVVGTPVPAPPTANVQPFSFGAALSTTASVSSFGSSKPAFSFGSAAPLSVQPSITPQVLEKAPSFTFGAPAANSVSTPVVAAAAPSAPAFSFGAQTAPSSTAPVSTMTGGFGSSTSQPFKTSTAPTAPFSFGSSNQPVATTASVSFGTTHTVHHNSVPVATLPSAAPTAFGSAQPSPAPAAPSFNTSSLTVPAMPPAPTTVGGGFGFSSGTAMAPVGGGGGFSVGATPSKQGVPTRRKFLRGKRPPMK